MFRAQEIFKRLCSITPEIPQMPLIGVSYTVLTLMLVEVMKYSLSV
jgi:hypothetical protein